MFRQRIEQAIALCAVALVLVTAMPAAAAEAPTPGAKAFGDVVDVRVVNVEVVVTDDQGHRVPGLTPDDFELLVDGERVPIDYFSEIRDGRGATPEAESAAAVPAAPVAAQGEDVGVSYLVFVDDYFAIARDRNRVLAQLAADLPQLRPGDRMAVVAFDGSYIDLVSDWSTSKSHLAQALDAAQARPAKGLQRLAELRNHDRVLRPAPSARVGDPIRSLPVEDRFFAQEVANQVEREVAATVATLRGFANAPGRKVMLVLAGGWPFSVGAYAAGSPLVQELGDVPAGNRVLQPLIDAANLLGYTVYPVDVPGLSTLHGADVERGGLLRDSLRGLPETTFADFDSFTRVERESNLEDTLRYVAEETGGEALINSRRLSALASAAQDTRSYYWLGFSPQREGNDRRHSVRVKLTDRAADFHVRTRKSYFDLSRASERDMAVEGALLFGGAPRGSEPGPGGLRAELGTAQSAGWHKVEVPLSVHIPTDLLTVLPEGNAYVARVELRVGAQDESRRRSDIPTVPVELRFPEPPPPGQLVTVEQTLKLRKADQDLVISITDVTGGDSAATRLALNL
jgi:VWFA-related protein